MTDKALRAFWALCLAACLCLIGIPRVHAEADPFDDRVWTLTDEAGQRITQHAMPMNVGDEYISGKNRLYRVVSVNEDEASAVAQDIGAEPFARTAPAFAPLTAFAETQTEAPEAASGEKRIAMYSTHSDESYVPSDGESSLLKDAGIYDVGNALKDNLEKLGIHTVYSEATFHPHDAGAYSRSRTVAKELLESERPDALIDIHRDGIPKEEYETEVDGEETSMVRLFVGRNNPNSEANREFAKALKAAADEKYPGLIKDIFIGKGNYNQELYPQAILLEFGTHEIEKEKAIDSTEYMADVLNDVLFGGTAYAESAAEPAAKRNTSAVSGGIFAVVIALLAAGIYALISAGSGSGAWHKLKRGASEITGGMFGEKPDDDDQK